MSEQREDSMVKKGFLPNSTDIVLQNQGLRQPKRGGKGAVGQRNKTAGLVLVAHLRSDITLIWILPGFVGV